MRSGAEDTSKNTVESFFTYRGHRGAVLCAAMCEENGWVATGGLDAQVALWKLPPSKQELYDC
jgi:WD40 repeat protein